MRQDGAVISPEHLHPADVGRRVKVIVGDAVVTGRLGPFQKQRTWIDDTRLGDPPESRYVPGVVETEFRVGPVRIVDNDRRIVVTIEFVPEVNRG